MYMEEVQTVVPHLEFQRSVTQTKRLSLWKLSPKLHESVLERTEMRMVRWMCGTSLREKKTSESLKDNCNCKPNFLNESEVKIR